MSEIIMYDSDEAAHQQTVTGWVSKRGFFYGDDERAARWDGCTHLICECGRVMEKSWTKCITCRRQKAVDEYNKKEKKQWNGTDMLYSETLDKFFLDEEEVSEYVEEIADAPVEDFRFIICEPVFAHEIEPADYYGLDWDDECDVPQELKDAFDELNDKIRECKTPLYWKPGKYAAIMVK
jgi:hypothetical protein